MDFNIRKIYTAIIASILVISIVMGVSLIEQNKPDAPANAGNKDVILGTIPDDETEDPLDSNTEIPTPTFTNAFKSVENALDYLFNGKGFKSTTSITAMGSVAGIQEGQMVLEHLTRSGNYYLKETTAEATTSLGRTFYRYLYSDNYVDANSTILYRRTSTLKDSLPVWGSNEETSCTFEYAQQNYDKLLLFPMSYNCDRTNSSLIKFDKSSNSNYVIISFNFNIEHIPEFYIDNIKNEGGLEWVKFHSSKVTYYISKKTGYLRMFEKEESYTIKKGLEVTTKATSITEFSTMNKAISPLKPY